LEGIKTIYAKKGDTFKNTYKAFKMPQSAEKHAASRNRQGKHAKTEMRIDETPKAFE